MQRLATILAPICLLVVVSNCWPEKKPLPTTKQQAAVAAAEKHQTSRLLNAITTPNVYVREAVMASAAVPGFYPPVALAAKNSQGQRQAYMPSRKWVDGSISDDLPAKRLARLYGANHFIVSQVNPHIFPFVNETAEDPGSVAPLTRAARRSYPGIGQSNGHSGSLPENIRYRTRPSENTSD